MIYIHFFFYFFFFCDSSLTKIYKHKTQSETVRLGNIIKIEKKKSRTLFYHYVFEKREKKISASNVFDLHLYIYTKL